MTTVQIRRDKNGVSGICVKNHSGYGEYGTDIVCAAASVLITTCANALESVVGLLPDTQVNERTTTIDVALPQEMSPEKMHDAQVVFGTVIQGFEDIASEYPEYLKIL